MEFRIDIGEVYINVQSFFRFKYLFNISHVTNRATIEVPRNIFAALQGQENCSACGTVIEEYQNRKSKINISQ